MDCPALNTRKTRNKRTSDSESQNGDTGQCSLSTKKSSDSNLPQNPSNCTNKIQSNSPKGKQLATVKTSVTDKQTVKHLKLKAIKLSDPSNNSSDYDKEKDSAKQTIPKCKRGRRASAPLSLTEEEKDKLDIRRFLHGAKCNKDKMASIAEAISEVHLTLEADNNQGQSTSNILIDSSNNMDLSKMVSPVKNPTDSINTSPTRPQVKPKQPVQSTETTIVNEEQHDLSTDYENLSNGAMMRMLLSTMSQHKDEIMAQI